MKYGINQVLVAGNLGTNPEVSRFDSGKVKARLFIIVGDRQERVDKVTGEVKMTDVQMPVNCEVWGPTAEYAERYLKKGAEVLIRGQYELNSWEDKEGKKKSSPFIRVDQLVGLGNTVDRDRLKKAVVNSLDDMVALQLTPEQYKQKILDTMPKPDDLKF